MKSIKRTPEELLKMKRAKQDNEIKNKIREIERATQAFQDDVDAVPPNFYSMIVSFYGNPSYPKCNAVLGWVDNLWSKVYEPAKNDIMSGGNPALSFSGIVDRPYSFGDCKAEILGA
jgi:hypothetical protein